VVGELLDHLTASCHGGGQTVGQLLTTEHPMQPFSQRCFAGPSAIASYNRAWLPAEKQAEPRPFWSVPLDPPVETEAELKGVELARLVRFWRNPVHFFLTRVLGLRVDRDSAALEESEPFVLNGLQQFQLRQQTVGDLLSGRESEELFAALAATGQLPQVPFDRLAFTDLADQAERLAEPLHDLLAEPREPLAVHLDLGRWHLTGQLTGCFRTGRVAWRSGARKAADLVELWLLHLVLHLAGPADLVRRSTYLARDRNGTPQWFVLGPVDDPAPLLRDLLDRYQLGLTRPLHFFPKTALAWAEAAPGREMARARAAWTTSEWSQGEDAEPAYAWFFADIDPLDEAFAEQATLFRTILAHQEN
jgi:exodeoxyribonuclease V gamma subunit